MGNLLSFKIKVKNENNEIDHISVNSSDKIKQIKTAICKIQKKYIFKYLLIYKDDQLLDDNNTVSSYNIVPNDTLIYKSSKKIYCIFFKESDTKAGAYVTDDDTISSRFYSVSEYFPYPGLRKIREFFFDGYKINSDSTFGDHKMKEFDCIVVKYANDTRKG